MATLLSVMMPVYNGAAYVREAIDSVLRQRFKDFEFLIMDDGSVDESPAILQQYAERDARRPTSLPVRTPMMFACPAGSSTSSVP